MRWGANQWLIRDTFHREWRLWLAPREGNTAGNRLSRWDLPGEPLFHLLPQAFDDRGARDNETASDLLAIYDALTGTCLAREVPSPLRDRRGRLRGLLPELRRVLYIALEAQLLKYEQHQVPWPFPEPDERPAEHKPQTPVEERPGNLLLRVVDEAGVAVDGIEVIFEARGQKRQLPTDGSGKARWDGVEASAGTLRMADVRAVLKKLRPRYKQARKRQLPRGAEVTCLELAPEIEPIPLTADVEHTLVLEPPKIDLEPQKPTIGANIGSSELYRFDDLKNPLLIASNDLSFLPEGPQKTARTEHEKRDTDETPDVKLPGAFAPFHLVSTPKRPNIRFDHGFLDDGNGNLDPSKRREPRLKDYILYEFWDAGVEQFGNVRPDMHRAVRTYHHFLHGNGADYSFSYEAYATEDRAGALTLESIIEDARAAAIELHEVVGRNGHESKTFQMQTDGVACGEFKNPNPRYPYPGTENWQKSIGAHVVWIEANVKVQVDPYWYGSGFDGSTRTFTIELVVHAEDRYNFNRENVDLTTGIPDSANGIFEVTGLAHEFMNYATLKRTITFTVAAGPSADKRVNPGNQKVTKHR